MSLVNITNVIVLDNPTQFSNPFQFEITFECLQELSDDLEWKVLYVGSAEDSKHDQTLEEVMVGPVPVGVNKFVLQAPSPDFSLIPTSDVLGVTVVLVTCSFLDHEFVRIGYYVNNEYAEPLDPEAPLPDPLEESKIFRNLLADQPRVTRFPIDWSGQSYAQGQGADTSAAGSAAGAPLPITLSADEMPAMQEEEGEGDGDGDGEMVDSGDEEEEDDEEDEEGDEMGEVDLEDEEDEEEEGEEEEEEPSGGEGAQVDGRRLVGLNEDSMDVAGMQQMRARAAGTEAAAVMAGGPSTY